MFLLREGCSKIIRIQYCFFNTALGDVTVKALGSLGLDPWGGGG